MTIPSRPAPAPPVARGQNAAAGANASIEQLRRQLEHQQNGDMQKLTIKLPPPPKGHVNGLTNNTNNYHNHNNNNNNNSTSNNSSNSITRKFPKARYAPATNWDDSPFDAATATRNGNFKKVPPPRPPPPRVQVNGRKTTAPVPANSGLLTNIFHRKKTTTTAKASSSAGAANRIYGVSSGTQRSRNITTSSSTTNHITTNSYSSNSWNAANWNTNSSHSAATFCTITATNSQSNGPPQEGQLISFDSPPSSPTFTQKSNSDCVSVDSFSSDSNFSSPNNGSVSQPESGFEDDFSASRSRPPTTSPLDPWETFDTFSSSDYGTTTYNTQPVIGTAPVRNLSTINTRLLASNDNPLCNGKSLLPPAPSLAAPTIIKPKISQKPKAPKPPVLAKPYKNYNGGAAAIFDADLPTPPSPPMPQCAPPPLPSTTGGNFSLFDVITGKVDAIHLNNGSGGGTAYIDDAAVSRLTPYGLALYDFDGAEEGDLSFKENDKIYLLEQISAEWYHGRTRKGCEGIFPTNYIDVKVPLVSATVSVSANSGLSSSAATPTYQPQHSASFSMGYRPVQVRCIYNFPVEVDGDLALKENDLVTVLYRINEDWLHGEIAGRQGQFPSNFLEYVPDNIPLP